MSDKKEKANETLNKVSEFILKRVRRMFLCHRYFWKDYADNLLDAKRFVAENNIIALGLHSEQLKFYFEKPVGDSPETNDPEFIKIMMEEHNRAFMKKEFRKKKRAILFYVEDNYITRSLGFKETRTHRRLAR